MEKVVSRRPGELTRLGSYDVIRKLARGGMAELFLARAPGTQGFEKLVALKKILPKYAGNRRFVQLFCDEARLAASLDHRNIVQVYDVGVDHGNYFFAMEYLHGQDVRTILHRAWRDGAKMPVAFAVQIAGEIAAALHYAHEKQRADGTLLDVIHRDVSPSNIIVSYDGAVKLVDFGVAKAATSTVKTRTGTLKGKISYMSPEQAKGAPIDRRSDIFSLGIVLWEMCTTHRLFRGENDLATLQLIINEPPKHPSLFNPEVPPELERIILKALSQDLANRYPTAAQVLHDLEAFAVQANLGVSPAALSAYMSSLFGAEMMSWNEAKAAGVPLAEHLTSIGDLTTPVSESEFIEAIDLDAEDEDDDGEHTEEADEEPSTLIPPPQAPVAGTMQARPMPPPVRRDHTPLPGVPRQVIHTPSGAVARPIAPTPSGAIPGVVVAAMPAAVSASTPVPLPPLIIESGMATPANPWPAATTPGHGVPVTAERPSMSGRLATMTMKLYRDVPPLDPIAADRTRKIAIWAGGALLLGILVIAIAKGGGGGGASAVEPAAGSSRIVDSPAPDAAVAPPVLDAAVEAVAVPADAAGEAVPDAAPPSATAESPPRDAPAKERRPSERGTSPKGNPRPPERRPPNRRPARRPKFDPNAPLLPR